MLLSFEVCEVCCDYQSHANPRDSPGHLFPGTSVHRLGLYSVPAQLPGSGLSILILRGPQDGEEAIFRDCSWTISDLLMQTFGSRINIIQYISGYTSTKFGIWWEHIWITRTFHNVSDFAPLSSDKEFLKEFLESLIIHISFMHKIPKCIQTGINKWQTGEEIMNRFSRQTAVLRE